MEEETGTGPPAAATDEGSSFRGRVFDRNVVFITTRGDSAIIVPWLIDATTRPGGVDREARGWLARGESWEPFFAETWQTEPTRTPWRILPRGSMRLVVGPQDALERIVFADGTRELEVSLEAPMAEWNGPSGETFRLVDGAVVLADRRVSGLVLDMSRARQADDPAYGDWALLTSGDSLQVLIQGRERATPESRPAYRGWGRLAFRELRWPEVMLERVDFRAFQRARRDVPVAWNVGSANAELGGTLEVRTAHLEAGEGEGPQRPVDGLFEIEGSLRIGQATYPVRGFFRHIQR